ncbi:MAG: CRISPR-associated endoribonuclease Cas6 [Chitinophagaceae bacterium]|nr:CRISPR-associated endoribonuclease Cas6 [Chitinophagaceae bacterium]
MRIYVKLSNNSEQIDFNYQKLLTGVVHKWLGLENEVHGKPARFTFSWIQNTKAEKGGLALSPDSYFFVSAYDDSIIRRITEGILKDNTVFHGIFVRDVILQEPPLFEKVQRFSMASPVLLKRRSDNKHLTYEDAGYEIALTENLKTKLEKAGISPEGVEIKLDPDTAYRSTKLVTYNGIQNKTTFAPLIIKGNNEQLTYVWSVGLGHSTGIGFGALK